MWPICSSSRFAVVSHRCKAVMSISLLLLSSAPPPYLASFERRTSASSCAIFLFLELKALRIHLVQLIFGLFFYTPFLFYLPFSVISSQLLRPGFLSSDSYCLWFFHLWVYSQWRYHKDVLGVFGNARLPMEHNGRKSSSKIYAFGVIGNIS